MNPQHSDCAPALDKGASEAAILSAIYPDLGRLASYRLRKEPLGYLWSPASLINEAYIRVVSVYGKDWVNYTCPLALWGRVMTNVLIDHARAFRARKRDWGKEELYKDSLLPSVQDDLDTKIAVRVAVTRLGSSNQRKARAIRMTALEGFTIDEAAVKLKVTPRTVKRVLRSAKDDLRRQLTRTAE